LRGEAPGSEKGRFNERLECTAQCKRDAINCKIQKKMSATLSRQLVLRFGSLLGFEMHRLIIWFIPSTVRPPRCCRKSAMVTCGLKKPFKFQKVAGSYLKKDGNRCRCVLGLVHAAVPRRLMKHEGIGKVKDGSYIIGQQLLSN
jgi:hypothetical protein